MTRCPPIPAHLEVVRAWKGMWKWLRTPLGWRKPQNKEMVSLLLGCPSSSVAKQEVTRVPATILLDMVFCLKIHNLSWRISEEFSLLFTLLGDMEFCNFGFVVRTPYL